MSKPEKLSSEKEFKLLKPLSEDYSKGVKGCKGLSMRVRPHGTKEWRFRYTHPVSGTRPSLTISQIEYCSLSVAIDIANELTRLLKNGISPDNAIKTKLVNLPSESNSKNTIANTTAPSTFSELADMWVEHRLAGSRVYASTTVEYWHRNIKYLNEYFGDTAPASVNTQMIHTACEENQKERGNKVGLHMRSYCESILKFGKIRGWLKTNEATDTKGELLSVGAPRNHPALLKKIEIGRLLYSIEALKETRTNPNTIRLLLLLPHVFVRSIDMRSMRWADIDLEAKRWVFAPKKGVSNEKMVDTLIVPLSSHVLKELLLQKAITGSKEYVFASTGNTKNDFISRNVLNSALERCGFKGEQSPHGFRATAKTVAIEDPQMGFTENAIELQLGHKIKDTHGNAYNRVELLDERTVLMESLSNWLLSAVDEYKQTIDNNQI